MLFKRLYMALIVFVKRLFSRIVWCLSIKLHIFNVGMLLLLAISSAICLIQLMSYYAGKVRCIEPSYISNSLIATVVLTPLFQRFLKRELLQPLINATSNFTTEENTYHWYNRWYNTQGKEKEKKNGRNRSINREFFNYVTVSLRNTSYPGVENYTRYVVARLGLLPLVDAEPLKPEFGPVINDVLSFPYPITIQPCSNGTVNQISVFVAVISAPNNFEKREMIRQTWKNHLKTENQRGLLVIAGFGFVLGLTANNVTQAKIEEESQLYGDIIQIGVSDFYRNLSSKVAGLFNWLYRHCSKVDFLLKVDDDVYVNIRNLVRFIQSHNDSKIPSIFGTYPSSFIPNREGKWEITFDQWPWNRYPYYVTGGAILIRGSAILPLLAACQTTPMMPFDDVYLTGMCTEKAGIKILFLVSFFVRKLPVACDLGHVIAWVSDNQAQSHLAINFYRSTIHQCIF